MITNFQTLGALLIQKYERYLPTAFDESMSLVQKVNKVIIHLNQIGELTNDVVDQWNTIMQWFLEEGLSEAVENQFNTLVESGEFVELVQVALDEMNQELNDRLNHTTNYIYVKSFGAKGDGVTDDTNAIKSAISHMESNNLKGYLVFGNGVFKHTGFTITKPNIGIKGENATIYGGTVKVHGEPRITEAAIPDFNFRCEGVEFSAPDNAIDLLSLKNVRVADIVNCVFRKGNKAFVVEQGNYSQHVNRVMIDGCRFYHSNYFIYANSTVQDINMFDASWGVGDLHITDNQFFLPNITHIYARDLDGLVMNGNTLFFTPLSNTTTSHHLDIYKLNWGNISSNQFFESGLESIKIGRFKGLVLANNTLINSGLRVPSSAIKLFDGDTSALKNSSSIVSQNVIFDATKHGIEIGINTESVIVSLNNIRDIGVGKNYFGVTELNTITHYAIEQLNPIDSLLLGNMASGYDIYSLVRPSSLAANNITSKRDKVESKPTAEINNASIVNNTVDVNSNDLYFANIATDATIHTFTGVSGKRITLAKTGAGVLTIQYTGGNIRTKTSANVVLNATGQTVEFINISGVWYEV